MELVCELGLGGKLGLEHVLLVCVQLEQHMELVCELGLGGKLGLVCKLELGDKLEQVCKLELGDKLEQVCILGLGGMGLVCELEYEQEHERQHYIFLQHMGCVRLVERHGVG